MTTPAAAATRWLGFMLVWLVLAGKGLAALTPADWAVAAASAACAAAVSLRLLAPRRRRASLPALARFAGRFLVQSVHAGTDVARRVLDPRLPLNPGFVRVATACPAGTVRDAFRAVASLQPGTLPVGGANGVLVIHCLDAAAPVSVQIGRDEALFLEALGERGSHG